jgi:hypothetical protein
MRAVPPLKNCTGSAHSAACAMSRVCSVLVATVGLRLGKGNEYRIQAIVDRIILARVDPCSVARVS